jgi:glucose/arabinose dehydrogenase
MRNTITTVMLITALAAMSVVGLAASPAQTPAQPTAKQQSKPAAKQQSKPAAKQQSTPAASASHAMTGVVKSVDATSLVITRSGKPGGEMRFVLNPSTHREGTVAVGSSIPKPR